MTHRRVSLSDHETYTSLRRDPATSLLAIVENNMALYRLIVLLSLQSSSRTYF